MEINQDIALALSTGAGEKQIKQLALEGGMKTMIDDGINKLNQTTLAEIIRVVPIEMIKEFRTRQEYSAEDEHKTVGFNGRNRCRTFQPDAKLIITDPEADWLMIDRLYERYEFLRKKVGRPEKKIAAAVFRDFIGKSFKEVCEQYECDSVVFYLFTQSGKVEISATAQVCKIN